MISRRSAPRPGNTSRRKSCPEPPHGRHGGVPREVLDDMAKLGFFGLRVPEEHGGIGLGALASVVFAEELGRSTFGGFSITVLVHTDLAMPYLTNFGSEEQKARWLPGMVTGEVLTAIAVTEPDAGSDVAAIRTTAQREGDGFVINGTQDVHHQRRDRRPGLRRRQDRPGRQRLSRDLDIRRREGHARLQGQPWPWRRWDGTRRTRPSWYSRMSGFPSPIWSARRTGASTTSCRTSRTNGSPSWARGWGSPSGRWN